MYLIYEYESDCSSTDSDQGELGSREIRKVYLVTSQQADPAGMQNWTKGNRALWRVLCSFSPL